MTKEQMQRAINLDDKIRDTQREVNVLKKLIDSSERTLLTNHYYNFGTRLTETEKALILPTLLERKTEELKLLQEEFERL